MTIGDFWVGISKKNEDLVVFVQGRGAFMAAWLSGETCARYIFGQFCSGVFWKKATFESFVCVGAETTIFSHMLAKMAKSSFALVSVCGPKFARDCVFVGGCVGGLVFGGAPHLALSPPCFCWFVLGIIGVLFALFFFETNIQCLPFFSLACLSLSLSLSLFSFSLSLSLSLSYFAFPVLFHVSLFFIFMLSCFFCFGGGGVVLFVFYMKWTISKYKLKTFLSWFLSVFWFPKGHFTWPLKPEYFSWFVFLVCFLFGLFFLFVLLVLDKKTVPPPPEIGIFCLFLSVSLSFYFSLSLFFHSSPSHFLVLSRSTSHFSCFSPFSFPCFVCLCCFCRALCFMKRTSFINHFCLGVSCLVCFSDPLFIV